MSRKGDCYDNTPMESFFHSMKVEQVNGCRYPTRGEAKTDIFEYIEASQSNQATFQFELPVTQGLRESEGRLMSQVSTKGLQDHAVNNSSIKLCGDCRERGSSNSAK